MSLNLLKNEHIVAFAAHPDDEGNACATLSKYSSLGAKVSIVWLTLGDRFVTLVRQFSHLLPSLLKSFISEKSRLKLSKTISNIRFHEALNSARLINATPHFLQFKDSHIPHFSDRSALLKITDLLRAIKPTIILTHYYRALHPDHRATSYLITRSFLLANNPKFHSSYSHSNIRLLAFWFEPTPHFRPNFLIEASNHLNYFNLWNKSYPSQSSRLVGRFVKLKYHIFAKNSPYIYAEPFIIFKKSFNSTYGKFFPL